jgi:glycosyltransferase involved in cell wall biosynthesis
MKIAIILPTFNAARHLDTWIFKNLSAFESVDATLIHIDNKSADDTVAILARNWCRQRITIINDKNFGQEYSIRLGEQLARDYDCHVLLGADDYLEKQYVDESMMLLSLIPTATCLVGVKYFSDPSSRTYQAYGAPRLAGKLSTGLLENYIGNVLSDVAIFRSAHTILKSHDFYDDPTFLLKIHEESSIFYSPIRQVTAGKGEGRESLNWIRSGKYFARRERCFAYLAGRPNLSLGEHASVALVRFALNHRVGLLAALGFHQKHCDNVMSAVYADPRIFAPDLLGLALDDVCFYDSALGKLRLNRNPRLIDLTSLRQILSWIGNKDVIAQVFASRGLDEGDLDRILLN